MSLDTKIKTIDLINTSKTFELINLVIYLSNLGVILLIPQTQSTTNHIPKLLIIF
jgi:hypothetical protein